MSVRVLCSMTCRRPAPARVECRRAVLILRPMGGAEQGLPFLATPPKSHLTTSCPRPGERAIFKLRAQQVLRGCWAGIVDGPRRDRSLLSRGTGAAREGPDDGFPPQANLRPGAALSPLDEGGRARPSPLIRPSETARALLLITRGESIQGP